MKEIHRKLWLAILAFIFGGQVSAAALDFEARLAAQRAIEQVYWSHRIWPEENVGAKPSLDEILPEPALSAAVDDYLRKSNALEMLWGVPITPDDLRAEMRRMAEHSAAPGVLRELYEALGSDPFLIAETIARPALAERRLGEVYVRERAHKSFEDWWRETRESVPVDFDAPLATYELVEPLGDTQCAKDTWTPTNDADVVGKPEPRHQHTAVWTGAEMVVWGGRTVISGNNPVNTGGRYVAATDSWIATSLTGVPSARHLHSAVWTGTEMIVWGGLGTNTGGRYNPSTNTWTMPTSTIGAPPGRGAHSAVWTGTEMIVWGGYAGGVVNTGGRYNPTSDTWASTTTTAAPAARWGHTAVRAGAEMIVWGGDDNGTTTFNTGGHYVSGAPQWTATELAGAPVQRTNHTAVWTGSRMVIWGGANSTGALNSGGRYDPTTDPPLWSATTLTGAPTERTFPTSVWTGCEMIVWGGFGSPDPDTQEGGRYDPVANRWLPTRIPGAPLARFTHTAVWTGDEMIVWGGNSPPGTVDYSSGGRYCACPCPITPVTGNPTLKFSTKTLLSWTALASATGYDLVRGDLALLRSSGGNFISATTACAGEDVTGTSTTDTTTPPLAGGLWYVLRGVDRCSATAGTYNSGGTSQMGVRDAEIAASGNDCTP